MPDHLTPKAPDLEWLDDGVPRAPAFGDTYFSRAGGLAETRHVFLGGNGLPERWAGRQHFTIAEFGFGTGLNFLTTLAALESFVKTQPAPKLTFLTFELYPMTASQLEKAHSAFPELSSQSARLRQLWLPEPGWKKLSFGQADLVIGIGDARELTGGLVYGEGQDLPQTAVDAWFLDGFSPSKNPELWDAELLARAYGLTRPGGTLATYTSAGWVRRNLQAAGFEIAKQKGFAGKREMVAGRKAPAAPDC